MRFIGDVHGKYKAYRRIIRDCPASIQVGDMGIGFRRRAGYRAGEFFANPPHYAMVPNHRFIRGNHDNPAECRKNSQWIADGHVEGSAMFIGGGLSIDKEFRQEGYDWWPDEELRYPMLYELTDRYLKIRPKIMVTHDCPEEVAAEIAAKLYSGGLYQQGFKKLDWASRTRQAFQAMWSAHSPDLWIFGHWHHHFDHVLRGTRFICLAELQYMDLELPPE